MKFGLILTLMAMVTGEAGAASPPGRGAKAIDKIPVYRGAVLLPPNDTLPVPMLGFTLDSGRLYLVKAGPEEVVRYYQKNLSAREVTGEEFDGSLDRVESGELAGALMTLEWHNFKSPGIRPPVADLIQKRPPYRPGQWVSWARLTWSKRQPGGELAQFGVGILDAPDLRRAAQGTILLISAGAPGGDSEFAPAGAEEAGAGGDVETSDGKAPLAEPGAADLGVPRYPGAVFDGKMSAGMSSDEERYYVYTTTDAPAKVIAFYESQTGKKGLKTEGGVLIAVQGTGLFPKLGVMVQPNAGTYPPNVKTMITVRRGE